MAIFSDIDHSNTETKYCFTEKKFSLNIHEWYTATEHLSNNKLVYLLYFFKNYLEWQGMINYIINLSNPFNSLPNFEAKIITLPLNFIIYKLAFKKTLPKRQSKLP